MKKKDIKILSFEKATITKLTDQEISGLNGGQKVTDLCSCPAMTCTGPISTGTTNEEEEVKGP